MAASAAAGAAEGSWLRAERQTGGKGRLGREWQSPAGNFYGSTVVRLRRSDPPAATLALVTGVALAEAAAAFAGRMPPRSDAVPARSSLVGDSGPGLALKWPNDLLLAGAKLAGILLERAGDAVVIGIGANLAHHPRGLDRPTTSLAAHGVLVDPEVFGETLADSVDRWLARWRGEGLAVIRAAWLAAAHPVGAALSARLPDGHAVDGLFDGLDADGALLLRLAGGERRVIHAGDVFLI